MFNPWGADTSTPLGWASGKYNQIYGLFLGKHDVYLTQFLSTSFGTGAINGNDIDEPVNALAGSATGNGGYARTGTVCWTRPGEGTATGVDLWLASYAGDGVDADNDEFHGPAERTVVSPTDPRRARTRRPNRTL